MPIVSQFLGSKLIKSHLQTVSVIQFFPWNWQGNKRVLSLSLSFRYFPENKSRKQNTETEQARPQLHFAPKIIRIHLVVLENELIEVCKLVSKKCWKRSPVNHALMHVHSVVLLTKGPLPKFQYTYFAWRRDISVTVFDTFLEQHVNFNWLVL